MAQRGRKSGAAKVVAAIAPVARECPKAPDELAPEEAAVWGRVVSDVRPGWWRPEYREQLMAYCRNAVAAERWARVVRGQWDGDKLDVDLALRADRAYQLSVAQMLSCARAMRLTAQSQTRQTAKDGARTSKKPWQA